MCKHCWDEGEKVHHKDFIRGCEDPEDFEKEVNYRPGPKNKTKAKKHRGCPGNDFGAHVYVWTTEFEPTGLYITIWSEKRMPTFYERHGFHRQEVKACVGCGKITKRRYTEQFNKLVKKKGWYNANYG